MTDHELNKAIMFGVYPLESWIPVCTNESCIIDYCNNWNDLMPLVVEEMLSIEVSRNMVDVRCGLYDESVYINFYNIFTEKECSNEKKEKLTKRALAECLLKVLESKKENEND